MDHFDKTKIKDYIIIICALVIFRVLMITGIYRCPIRRFLGIPCPLCGISRALGSVLDGDFAASFYYHPLWPVIVIFTVFYLLAWLRVIKPSEKLVNIVLFTVCILLVACFIWRHICGSDIVRIDFASSVLYKVIHFFV